MTADFVKPLGRGTMITRRHLLGRAGAGAALALSGYRLAEAAGAALSPGVPEGVGTVATMEALPGKSRSLNSATAHPIISRRWKRSPNPITPNDEFFVRYHLRTFRRSTAKLTN